MKESYHNPRSNRKNIFRTVYDNPHFKNVLKEEDSLPKFPFLVDIEITNHCNLKCVFCGQRLMTREKGYISEELFKKAVDECDRYGTPVRLIRWGESFLHPQIMSFISYVKTEKAIPLHVTTNGLCLNEAISRQLVELKLDSIIFSLQGATPKEYGIMRNNNRYEELKVNILKLVQIRGDKEQPYIQISTTVMDESENEIEDFVNYWGSIVDFISLGKTNLAYIRQLQDPQDEAIKGIEKLKTRETIEKVYLPCKEVYQKLSVNYDGTVSACCADFDNTMVVGDLKSANLEEIWNGSPSLKAFRLLLDKMQHSSLTLCKLCYPTIKI